MSFSIAESQFFHHFGKMGLLNDFSSLSLMSLSFRSCTCFPYPPVRLTPALPWSCSSSAALSQPGEGTGPDPQTSECRLPHQTPVERQNCSISLPYSAENHGTAGEGIWPEALKINDHNCRPTLKKVLNEGGVHERAAETRLASGLATCCSDLPPSFREKPSATLSMNKSLNLPAKYLCKPTDTFLWISL